MKMIRASRIAVAVALTCVVLLFGFHRLSETPVHAQSAPSLQAFVLDTAKLTNATSNSDGNDNAEVTGFYALPTSFSGTSYVVTCSPDNPQAGGSLGVAPPNFAIGTKSANGFYITFYNLQYEFYDCVAAPYGGLSGIVG